MGKLWRRLDREDPRAEVDHEIGFHLEMRAREVEAQGLSAEEARVAARQSFGDMPAIVAASAAERTKRSRERRRREMLRGLGGDVRFAARALRRNPVFASAAVVTLGVGIALVAAMAGLLNAYLVRGVAVPRCGPARVRRRSGRTGLARSAGRARRSGGVGPGCVFDRGWRPARARVGVVGDAGFFEVLGVRPALGRLFTAEEGGSAQAVAVISHRLQAIRDAVWSISAELPLNEVRWIEDDRAVASLPSRFLAWLLSGFALFAVLLATVGLYGVIAYAASERRREIAIRMALGADARRVLGLFLAQSIRLGGIGLAAG